MCSTKDYLQFAEGSETWKGETAFTPRTRKLTLSSALFPTHASSPSETIKGHLMSPHPVSFL